MSSSMLPTPATRELPNYIRERSFSRLTAIAPLFAGLQVLTPVLLDPSDTPRGALLMTLEVVVVSLAVICLLMAALLLLAPRGQATLGGSTLTTKQAFHRRRVDLATARLAIRAHILIATDPGTRRKVRLPLARPAHALPPPDLLTLADVIQAGANHNPTPEQAWRVGIGLRELATNEALRSDVVRKVRTSFLVLAISLGLLGAILAALLVLQVTLYVNS